jgi:hypothetical protein
MFSVLGHDVAENDTVGPEIIHTYPDNNAEGAK